MSPPLLVPHNVVVDEVLAGDARGRTLVKLFLHTVFGDHGPSEDGDFMHFYNAAATSNYLSFNLTIARMTMFDIRCRSQASTIKESITSDEELTDVLKRLETHREDYLISMEFQWLTYSLNNDEIMASLQRRQLKESDMGEGAVAACGVCLEDKKMGDEVIELACRHFFCVTCVGTWVGEGNRSCPSCRQLV